MKTRTLEDDQAWIAEHGWSEWPVPSGDECDRNWRKHFPGEPRCSLNPDKDLGITLRLWDHRKYSHEAGWRFDLVLRGKVHTGEAVLFR